MELGKEAADYVSATFIKPIKLEFEKARSTRTPLTELTRAFWAHGRIRGGHYP